MMKEHHCPILRSQDIIEKIISGSYQSYELGEYDLRLTPTHDTVIIHLTKFRPKC